MLDDFVNILKIIGISTMNDHSFTGIALKSHESSEADQDWLDAPLVDEKDWES